MGLIDQMQIVYEFKQTWEGLNNKNQNEKRKPGRGWGLVAVAAAAAARLSVAAARGFCTPGSCSEPLTAPRLHYPANMMVTLQLDNKTLRQLEWSLFALNRTPHTQALHMEHMKHCGYVSLKYKHTTHTCFTPNLDFTGVTILKKRVFTAACENQAKHHEKSRRADWKPGGKIQVWQLTMMEARVGRQTTALPSTIIAKLNRESESFARNTYILHTPIQCFHCNTLHTAKVKILLLQQ